jgi:hypothetical protein
MYAPQEVLNTLDALITDWLNVQCCAVDGHKCIQPHLGR